MWRESGLKASRDEVTAKPSSIPSSVVGNLCGEIGNARKLAAVLVCQKSYSTRRTEEKQMHAAGGKKSRGGKPGGRVNTNFLRMKKCEMIYTIEV